MPLIWFFSDCLQLLVNVSLRWNILDSLLHCCAFCVAIYCTSTKTTTDDCQVFFFLGVRCFPSVLVLFVFPWLPVTVAT